MYKGHSNVQIRSFFDQHGCGVTNGSTTNNATVIPAKKKTKEFINQPNINALDVQFVPGAVHIIYCLVEEDDNVGKN